MDLTNIEIIKSILKENGLWTKKKFGQNFLIDENVLSGIIKAADLKSDDMVLEIGPGLGILTEELAKKAKLVLAIEKDFKLVEYLRKRFKNKKNIKIIHEDILKFPISNFQFPIKSQIPNSKYNNNKKINQYNNYKVAANLPYNITSPVIRKFFENSNNFGSDIDLFSATRSHPTPSSETGTSQIDNPHLKTMVLMVQKEVGERLTAKPGDSSRGLLTVMVELYSNAKIEEFVNRESFWPVPSVDSAIIKIELKRPIDFSIDTKSFMRIVKIGFSQKRRKIYHPLIAGTRLPKPKISDILKEAKISSDLRAEDLTLDNWMNLYNILSKCQTSNS